MPFRSQAQAAWMFANKPEMAQEWASKTKSLKKLPIRKSDAPVWDKPDPTKTEDHLSKKKKASAKARAARAGRPYPNLVDNMAVSKALLNKEKITSAVKRRYLHSLADNEFYHGTSKENYKSIKAMGNKFSFLNDKGRYNPSPHLRTNSVERTTKTGRPIVSGNEGPGVYLTRNRQKALDYASPHGEPMIGSKHRGVVLRITVPKDTKWSQEHSHVASARKAGYQGIGNPKLNNDVKNSKWDHSDDYVYSNPKAIKIKRDIPVNVKNVAVDSALVGGTTMYVKHRKVNKSLSLDAFAKTKLGRRYLKHAPLGHNEYWTRTERTAGHDLKGKGLKLSVEKEKNSKRIKVPSHIKFALSNDKRPLTTEQAVKQGYGGTRASYVSFEGHTRTWNDLLLSDPKNAKFVRHKYVPQQAIVRDASKLGAGVAVAGYGTNKIKKFDTPAWTRSEGKNPNGGLNAKGRASAKAQGHNLKPPVKSGNNPRRKSFLARMGNMPGPEHKPNGEPTRLLLSLNAWGASSKADAKKKAAAMGVSKSWEEVSKVFPQRAILTQGTRKIRVMVHYEHSPTHWGIIHPTEGQRVAHKDHITFIPNKKPKSPGPDLFGEPLRKSMEYSVVMNQSRYGGASAVAKAYISKNEKVHFSERLLNELPKLAESVNRKVTEEAYKKGVRAGLRHNVKVLVPAGAAGGSAVTAAAMHAHYNKKRNPIPVQVVKADEFNYEMPAQQAPKKRNPLSNMSGNAKLATAGTGIGLLGAQRMINAGTLPNRLQGQADAAASRVAFQQQLANDQIARVQNASKIKNPITRRSQTRMHQYYSDNAQRHLSEARAKQITADNALKAAPAKKLAHLKSGGALLATGAAMGGLAAYNNSKERTAQKKRK